MTEDNFELREEIARGKEKYFLHTTFLPDDHLIRTQFYKDGVSFNTEIRELDPETGSGSMTVGLAKSFHNKNRDNFILLLDTREKIRVSERSSEHIKMAKALFLKNLFMEAVEEARSAVEKGEKGAEPYKIIADSYYGLGKLGQAMDAVDKGLELTEDYPDLHNLKGKIFFRRDQCRRAMKSFEKAIQINCYYGEPYINILRTYARNSVIKQDYELSRDIGDDFSRYLEKAASLNPGLTAGVVNTIGRMAEEGDFEGVLKELEFDGISPRGRDVDDTVVSLYITLLRSGTDMEEADIDLYLDKIEQLIDKNPNFPDLFNSLGVLYVAKSKILMDRAGDAFNKALEINSDYEKAKRNIRLSDNERQGIFILLKALLD
ncbi:MAG: hypothetical protein GF417_08250 [Candidatus Latescibacteria bacterium]|nr:hypothetical protein [Candidatus Latescibacterota bacterium]